jgi:putative inorganic carbon (hco3(-)) transporter
MSPAQPSQSRAATVFALLDLLAFVLAAPFLLFPSAWPLGVVAGLGILLVLAVARWILCRELWPATPYNAALFLFVLMLPVAVWASAMPDLTRPKILGVVVGLFAFRLAGLNIRDRRTLAWGLATFMAVGAAILTIGALSTGWLTKAPLLRPLVQQLPKQLAELPGTEGQAVNANQLASAALLYLPVTIALAVGLWREGRRWLTLAALAGAWAVAGLLLLTQSRSGWIGGAGGLVALAVLLGLASRRRWLRRAAILLPVVLILLLGIALITMGPRHIGELWPSDMGIGAEDVVGSMSLSGRVEIWSRALSAIQDFPFTGVGLGTFRRVVHLLYPLFIIGPTRDIAHAHNIFLQVALDIGLPGLIAYLALLWVAAAVAWHVARRGTPLLQALAIGLLCALVSLHFYGLTDALALGSKPSLAFWMILGLLAALPRVMDTDLQKSVSRA